MASRRRSSASLKSVARVGLPAYRGGLKGGGASSAAVSSITGATSSGWGTVKAPWQLGHFACFPAALSGRLSIFLQDGQGVFTMASTITLRRFGVRTGWLQTVSKAPLPSGERGWGEGADAAFAGSP